MSQHLPTSIPELTGSALTLLQQTESLRVWTCVCQSELNIWIQAAGAAICEQQRVLYVSCEKVKLNE